MEGREKEDPGVVPASVLAGRGETHQLGSVGLEVGQEVVVGGVAAAHLLHRDELLVLDEEHAVAVPGGRVGKILSSWIDLRLIFLDLFKDILTVISNCHSRRHD